MQHLGKLQIFHQQSRVSRFDPDLAQTGTQSGIQSGPVQIQSRPGYAAHPQYVLRGARRQWVIACQCARNHVVCKVKSSLSSVT